MSSFSVVISYVGAVDRIRRYHRNLNREWINHPNRWLSPMFFLKKHTMDWKYLRFGQDGNAVHYHRFDLQYP